MQTVRDGGPARRSVLANYAETKGALNGSLVVDGLLGSGELVMIGAKRNARYATPAQARSRR